MTRRFVTRRRDFLRLSAAAGLGWVIAACTPASGSKAPGSAAPTTDTSKLVVAVQTLGAQKWSPWLQDASSRQILLLVGEALIRMNPVTRKLEPGLAESWSVTPDGKTWTFKLRPNVPFQDGYGTVTAEDVRFTYQQYIQKDSLQAAAATLRQAIDNDMKNFEVVSPLEFRLRTTKPVVFLPVAISDSAPGPSIQSQKYWETKPDQAPVHPVGTGAFKFVSSTTGVEVQLAAVENHYRKSSAFKAVTVKVIPDDAARMAQVLSGAVDLAPIPPKLLGEARASGMAGGVKVISLPDTGTVQVILGGQYPDDAKFPNGYDRTSPWIQADSPAKGLAIRQAMSLAIDRKSILDKVLAGEGAMTHAPYLEFPGDPRLVDPSWPLPEYNVAKAKQKLAEGGYPNGFNVTMPIYDQPNKVGVADLGEAVAGMFEAIGLKVTRKPVDYATFKPAFAARATSGMAYIYASAYADEPVQNMSVFLLPTSSGPLFYDPVVTSGVTRMNAEFDEAKRYAIAREVLASLMQSVRAIPLFTQNVPFIAGKKVADWTTIPWQANANRLETLTPR